MFLSGRGKNRIEKEKNVCIGGLKDKDGNPVAQCKAFPSKFNKEAIERNEERLNAILFEAAFWRRKRNSGGRFNEGLVAASVFDCILMIDDHYEAFERDLILERNKLLERILEKPGL